MRLPKMALALSVFALAVASAASSYHVNVSNPVWVGGKQLKAGDYQVQVENGKAVFKNKKDTVEVPAKMETADTKFQYTTLNTQTAGGKENLGGIEIGGTKNRIVIQGSAGSVAGE